MGQSQSSDQSHLSKEQLVHELATKFGKKCFTSLELYSFQDVFRGLADHQDDIAYLKEDTIARFLEIPDILSVSSIIFQMTSYIGAFPLLRDAPAVLGFEQMIMVVVLMTERYQKVLRKGNKDRAQLLFRSLAVYDRHHETKLEKEEQDEPPRNHAAGFAVDAPLDAEDDEEDDDDLVLAALETLDAIDVFRRGDAPAPVTQASIPSDNLRKLIMLLLIIAPLHPQESLSRYNDRLIGEQLDSLRRTADNILAAFVNVERSPGVKMRQWNSVIPNSLPSLFDGLNPLFEHFLFSKNFDLNKKVDGTSDVVPSLPPGLDRPLLADEGEIMDVNVLSQLSFFIPQPLFRQLRLLYSGGESGFSMGSFETHVFNWRAPTILLVSGSRIPDPPGTAQEKAFVERLPYKRFPTSGNSSRLVFGIYLTHPWKQTHKECIGDGQSMLFQLEPVHEVFRASSINQDYVSFCKAPSAQAGISAGCPIPKAKAGAAGGHFTLGPVSLALDASFEFGVFNHDYSSGGGAYHNSATRRHDWQDRFEIESLEVWGCGGDTEAEQQRARWAWEEREAEARRRINLGTGDIEADRALLEMAGLIGGDRSGGSMG